MTEKIALDIAIRTMKSKDICRREPGVDGFMIDYEGMIVKENDQTDPFVFSTLDFISLWEIVPEEPKVLAAMEIVEAIQKNNPNCIITNLPNIGISISLVEFGHQNGRLERDLELRSLIDEARLLISLHWRRSTAPIKSMFDVLKKAVDDLKPLITE